MGKNFQSTAQALLVQYHSVRSRTRKLTEHLSAEDQTIQSMEEASPTKWHLAHTTWFFETFLLKPYVKSYQPLDPSWEYLFNSYYNGVGQQFCRADRGRLSRPGLEEIQHYRSYVDEELAKALSGWEKEGCLQNRQPLLTLGLHHEQQHQELILTDILHAFRRHPLRPAYHHCPEELELSTEHTSGQQKFLDFSGGITEVGWDGSLDGPFCFDNEEPRHTALLPPFALAEKPLTNEEVLSFLADGGYERPEFWLADGWNWVKKHKRSHPDYWFQKEGSWWQQTLSGPTTVQKEQTA
ncbi:MAG: DinB family protein, partial [Polyangiaceae bacterium]|nr:DinB family protein [Polyangiaceae bacterium]